MKRFALLALVLVAGCESYDLESRWLPLERIVVRPKIPSVSDSAITTLGPSVLTTDMEWFWKRYPKGSIDFEAVLRHEQAHSIRQGELPGRLKWEADYVSDANFMWREERIGWWFEISYQKKFGQLVNVDRLAGNLAAYESFGGEPMVTVAAAKTWILDVLTGDWIPPVKLIDQIEKAHEAE